MIPTIIILVLQISKTHQLKCQLLVNLVKKNNLLNRYQFLKYGIVKFCREDDNYIYYTSMIILKLQIEWFMKKLIMKSRNYRRQFQNSCHLKYLNGDLEDLFFVKPVS